MFVFIFIGPCVAILVQDDSVSSVASPRGCLGKEDLPKGYSRSRVPEAACLRIAFFAYGLVSVSRG